MGVQKNHLPGRSPKPLFSGVLVDAQRKRNSPWLCSARGFIKRATKCFQCKDCSEEEYPAPSEVLKWEVQSEPQLEEEVVMNVQENLGFADDTTMEVVDQVSLIDPSFDEDEDAAASLATYLSRPVLIDTFSWVEGPHVPLMNSFYPWDAFFGDAKILNKTKNFCRIHCKLHLKFVFNASPFYCGAMRACYFPLKEVTPDYDLLDLVPCSQTPGAWIEPQNSSSAELVLPYLHPYNCRTMT